MNKFMKNKRGQHEIIGFILIVVIVVIIGLFLLVFYIRKPVAEQKSLDVENFLQASMKYTTGCYLSIEPLNIEDLIKSCYKNERCLNEEMACSALEDDLRGILHESWLISSDKPVNSYSLIVYYEESSLSETEEKTEKEEILVIQEGNCTGSKTGAENLIHHSPGNIVVNLEVCYI